MKTTFAFCAFLAATVSAHMEMSNPVPIRSPLNKNGDPNKIDYSYTSPLDPSGSNFPCKGYQNDAFHSVATYTPGGQYDLSLAGSATHGGGSCQISLSYDTGKTFTVIQSMEGTCPLSSNYTFTVPSDAPTGQALLAWTWYNKIGNRELYMNCAQVTIGGSSSKRSHPRDILVARDGGSTPFKSRPPIFIANINGPGGCTTIGGQEVQFPLPGPDVVGKVVDPGIGYSCTGTADFLGSGSSNSSSSSSPASSAAPSTGASTGSSAGSSAGSSSASTGSSAGSSGASTGSSAGSSGSDTGSSPAAQSTAATSTSSSSASVAPAPVASSAPVPSVDPASTSPSSGAQVPGTPASSSSSAPRVVSSGTTNSGQACSTPGNIVCGSDGSTWSVCNQGALTFMGSVAAGTTCSNGAITRKK